MLKQLIGGFSVLTVLAALGYAASSDVATLR